MEGEGVLRIRVQGQNGMHNTKLRVFLFVLQILEVSQELLGGVGRSTQRGKDQQRQTTRPNKELEWEWRDSSCTSKCFLRHFQIFEYS